MTTCSFPDCPRMIYVQKAALCQSHYTQQRRGGSLKKLPPLSSPMAACPVPMCGKVVASRGLCGGHAATAWKMSIAPEDLARLLGGDCAICGVSGLGERLHFDHDHECCDSRGSCGECLRGVLCRPCNHGIGMLRESTTALRRAADYLEAPPGVETSYTHLVYDSHAGRQARSERMRQSA